MLAERSVDPTNPPGEVAAAGCYEMIRSRRGGWTKVDLDDRAVFGCEVAGDRVVLPPVDQRRFFDGADLLCLPAPGPEAATARRVDRARHIAFENDPLPRPLEPWVGQRDGREQGLRVRVRRSVVDVRLLPISTIFPRYMTATRSDMCRTTDRSWAMNKNAMPRRSWSSSRRLTTPAWTDTSSAETGSSRIMSFGSSTRARAIPMRWRWPPENSFG